MKKILPLILLTLILTLCVQAVEVEDKSYYEKFKDKDITLNVYNWGEYISDGSDGSMDIIKEFEEISGIKITYTTFETNEDLYAKLSSSNSRYDIIVPSEYMAMRMIDEGMLEKINLENIPNSKFVDESIHNAKDNADVYDYTLPYTWGAVGVVYNTKYVDKNDIGSWDLLWNEKYSGSILMFSNSRDAFGIALKRLGYSLNSTDEDEIKEATDSLKEQQNVNQAYVMDQVFNKMESESAFIAPYYAGDCLSMMDNNESLAFFYPKEGFNRFADYLCIPKGSKNKEAAEAFINFLYETEVSVANCEYICYFTPHLEAAKIVEYDPRIAMTDELMQNSEVFTALPAEINSLYDSSWIEIRSRLDISEIAIVAIILGLSFTLLIAITVLRRVNKGKQNY